MNQLGVPYFMEANLMPGLRTGYFYRSCMLNLDMNYDDMIYRKANTGLSSHKLNYILRNIFYEIMIMPNCINPFKI